MKIEDLKYIKETLEYGLFQCDDVIGNQSDEEVTEIMKKIQSLL